MTLTISSVMLDMGVSNEAVLEYMKMETQVITETLVTENKIAEFRNTVFPGDTLAKYVRISLELTINYIENKVTLPEEYKLAKYQDLVISLSMACMSVLAKFAFTRAK